MLEIKIPKKINPCPIHEAVMEIRFDPDPPLQAEVVFGLLYPHFREQYTKFEKMPVTEIPEPIRRSHPDFIYAAEYRLTNGDFVILIGPRIFALAYKNEYRSWSFFSDQIIEALDIIGKELPIGNVSRVALRYINLFEKPIMERLKLTILNGDEPLGAQSCQIIARIAEGKFEHHLRVVDNAEIKLADTPTAKFSSAIDIDTFIEREAIPLSEVNLLLEEAHIREKVLFFSLLSDEFLETLDPRY